MSYYEEQFSKFRIVNNGSFNFPLHFHGHVEIIYIEEGCTSVQIGEEIRVLNKGEMSFCFPNIIHGLSRCDGDDKCVSHLILIAPEMAGIYRKQLLECTPSSPFITADKVDDDIKYAINGMIRAYDDNDWEAASVYFNLMLMRALKILPLEENREQVAFDLMHQILVYLSKNYLEPINLDSIAKSLHVSKYQISRVMSSKLHTSLPTYLNQLRIGHAMELLQTTELTITQISEQCGFESERTFHRAFKNEFNTKPRKVRDRLKFNENKENSSVANITQENNICSDRAVCSDRPICPDRTITS